MHCLLRKTVVLIHFAGARRGEYANDLLITKIKKKKENPYIVYVWDIGFSDMYTGVLVYLVTQQTFI